MKKLIIILTFVVYLIVPALAQDNNMLSLFIRDSIRKTRVHRPKDGSRVRYLSKMFNKKLWFNLKIVNNLDHNTHLYFLSNHAKPLVGPNFNKLSCASDSVFRALNKDVGVLFGVTYSILDGEGYVVSYGGCSERTPIILGPEYEMFDAQTKTYIERKQKKLSNVLQRNRQRILNRINVVKSKEVRIGIFLKKYIRKPGKSMEYYPFESGETYFITFYYTLYIGNNYASPFLRKYPMGQYSLFTEITQDIKENMIDTNMIFQGQIKSNTVKLIVK